METHKGFATFYAASRALWRAWLEEHHLTEQGIWLIIYKKDSGTPSVYYPEAVDEALCFGWIDSKPNKRDEESYYQYFSKRNPKSNWSGVNKAKVERLLAENLMHPSGLEMMEEAKRLGTWTALDEITQGIEPSDLRRALDETDLARAYWDAFPFSTRRGILEWIFNAKTPATRLKRIEETVGLAAQNIRANQFRNPKQGEQGS